MLAMLIDSSSSVGVALRNVDVLEGFHVFPSALWSRRISSDPDSIMRHCTFRPFLSQTRVKTGQPLLSHDRESCRVGMKPPKAQRQQVEASESVSSQFAAARRTLSKAIDGAVLREDYKVAAELKRELEAINEQDPFYQLSLELQACITDQRFSVRIATLLATRLPCTSHFVA